MKLVVFSDAHGHRDLVDRILTFNPDADRIISLGDSSLDPSYLMTRNILHVKGNIGRDPGFVYHSDLEVGDIRLFLTHGHKFHVHRSIEPLATHAKNNGYDIALFGHTHVAHIERFDGVLLVNPGSCASPRNTLPPTYAILQIEGSDVEVTFKDVLTNRTIEFQ